MRRRGGARKCAGERACADDAAAQLLAKVEVDAVLCHARCHRRGRVFAVLAVVRRRRPPRGGRKGRRALQHLDGAE
eukprot:5330772-Prymnesium_polylepis.1